MIPHRRKRERSNIREPEQIRCPQHLQFVRGFACLVETKGTCQGKIEAHHVREGSNGGMGLKPDDSDVVPLCSYHHGAGHRIGWTTFQKAYSLNLPEIAAELWRHSPHRLKLERKA